MNLDIGGKIKTSRNEAGLTQEQAAESIGVSRQTVSNWENNKSYPDIISVIMMSDIYNVSLDYLLKGEKIMKNYYDYLEESTNVVKSNKKKEKIVVVCAYTIVWAFAMIAFWLFTADDCGIGYSLMYLWIILPVTTLVVSFFIGTRDIFGKGKWAASPILGIMYMLAEYGTFSMANNITFNKVNVPEWSMIITGTVISLAGIGAGILIRKIKNKRN